MLRQNRMLRRRALGSFRTLLRRRHARPGDAAVPVARRLRQGRAERELRARADGAVHARQRLHRDRRPRGRPRADRLRSPKWSDERAQRDPLRRRAPRRRRQADLRPPRPLRRRRRARPRRAPTRSTRRSWSRKLWSSSSPTPPSAATARALARDLPRSGLRIKPVVRRDPRATRRSTRDLDAPDMVKSPGRLRRRRAAHGRHVRRRTTRPDLAARADGPAAVRAAVGRRLGLGPGVDVVELDARCASSFGNYLLADDRPLRCARTARVQPDAHAAQQASTRALDARRPAAGSPRTDARLTLARRRLVRRHRRQAGATRPTRADMLQRALRHLLLAGPDAQLH